MMLPLSCNFEERETLDNDNFYINEMKIKNPFMSLNNLVNNFAASPPFGVYDIFNYLIHYDKQDLAA